jgi:TRAP-type C4-dicarboxylate transport system permease small subunit
MTALTAHIGRLVSQEERPLKTRFLDVVEYVLLVLAGLALLTFTVTVLLDVTTRLLARPILWLQEATLIAFVWGLFVGAAAAQRRTEHFVVTSLGPSVGPVRRKVVETINGVVLIVIGVVVGYFGYLNFLRGFGNQLTVTGLPLATLTGAIPVFGVLITVFSLERLVLGWRNGFPAPEHEWIGTAEVEDLEGGHV